eukprot:CAMPEP_0171336324 /NCGR_PEP_ID=MMETSP0878-20121228/5962_1 /TAXON_ID=67004 /ORGANISM="Thalassiosira weissflogii, Strain CCMP1336" /LENGTH=224 /DNA_ID=CAMNT_0011837773 /DNA_START=230 /DNA_END=904 /DNA_ORIENTATION=-
MPANPLADLAVPPEEMISLPPKPDSNSGFLIWPMSETFTMNYKNFSAIYPNYLDSNKTIKLGRRIAAKDAVSEPTIQDIHEALASLSIRHVIQPHKGYSRDAVSRWDNPGRVLVDLDGAAERGVLDGALGMRPDGTFDLEDDVPDMGAGQEGIDNGETTAKKKKLMRKLAVIIRDLPNRKKRLIELKAREDAEKLKSVESGNATSGGTSNGQGGNRKKKGKKKK